MNLLMKYAAAGLLAAFFVTVTPRPLSADPANDQYVQVNLVSDLAGVAEHTDPNLVNPWGVSFSGTSPFWVSDQGSNNSTLYDGAGNINSLVVNIPPVGTGGKGPTGQVFANIANNFVLKNGTAATFIFDTLDGQILGWNGAAGTTAVNMVTTPGAVYTGLAIAQTGGNNFIYAANTRGSIDVFNSSFTNVSSTTFAGKFVDPSPLAGFTPYNIQAINGNLYVTYASTTATTTNPGGFVDEFAADGTFIKRIATSGPLNAAWGITLAPSNFGVFSNDLLIGNFGNGEILAYDPNGTNAFLGTLDALNGNPIVDSGLWALDFRTGGTNDLLNGLYITAGLDNQQHGLFAVIEVAPEPGTLGLLGLALLAGGATARLRRRSR